jgi:SAM-dependent MidA family methyltransferase
MQAQVGTPELCAVIRDRIQRSPQQRIPFATFMDLALYHPDHGYYASNITQLGMTGDFVTSAHMGTDFAELLAEQFVEMWHCLGQPQPFQLVEMGAGQGLGADVILTFVRKQYPDFLAALQYVLIETSPALKQAQQTRLSAWHEQTKVVWQHLSDLAADSVTGCFFSNELVDALPVHRVTLNETGLYEHYVVYTEQPQHPFAIALGEPSTPELAHYFDALNLQLTCPPYPTGFTTEVNLAAQRWLAQVATVLHRGYVLTIDYGYDAKRYYSPARAQGTLQCYYRHAHHNEPLCNIGQQDITAHVNFTALVQHGERCGLETLSQTQQGLFLMALGLGDRLNTLAQLPSTDSQTIRDALQQRETLHQLINPLGLGKFVVLLQGKGLTAETQRILTGITVPPLG